MKIIYCINGTYNIGGMERVLANKVNYLVDVLGYEVCIITTEQKGRDSFFNFSSKIRFFDIEINYEDDYGKNIFLRFFKKEFKKIIHKKRLSKLLHQEVPDICISMFDMEWSFLYRINDGSKKILEYHFSKNVKIIEASNGIIRFLQRVRIFIWTKLIQKYDRFVVLTEEDKKAWGNYSNMCVIPNSIVNYPDQVSDLSAKTVISVGRLTYQKGFDVLINIWKIVHPHFLDWNLLIYGDGKERETLQNLIHSQNLDDCMFLKHTVKNIGQEYLNSSIYALTSRYEGLPMVLLEAMSYGLPVVAFACPCGPSDVISEVSGSIVPNGDLNMFAQKLMVLMENEELRRCRGTNASQEAKNYNHQKIMEKWDVLFNDVLISN